MTLATTRASAPGKLVLLGEYAVLEGAPAITLAIERRAQVQVAVDASGRAGCTVHAPDVHAEAVPFVIGPDTLPDWTTAGPAAGALTLVDDVLRGLAEEGLGPAPDAALTIALDTSAFFDTGHDGARHKLGLGSSAALTVALASAIACATGHDEAIDDRVAWLRGLLNLHRRFQGGQGSGVDVATSLVGGLLAYRLDPASGLAETEPLTWPAALHRAFVWSGQSASTPQFLKVLRLWRAASRANEADYQTRIAVLRGLATDAVAAIAQAHTPAHSQTHVAAFLDLARAYGDELLALGSASGVEIWSAAHRAIAAIADRQAGVVYKPCGAGGGDVGLLLARDPDALTATVAALAAAGYGCVALTAAADGLRLERE